MLTPTSSDRPLVITRDTILAPGVYHLPAGISIAADNVTLDGGGALLIGGERQGSAVQIVGREGVTVKNLRARDYYHGIRAERCRGLLLAENQVSATAEVPPNTIFLDIWLGPEAAYGGGVFLWDVRESRVENNDLQHQQSGLLTYHCGGLTVARNQVNYSSGYGIHLFGTCDSVFEANSADYCCRFEPREGGLHYGHMGADAAGFLAVHGSSRNVFRRNTARLGGDGFFLAGLGPDGVPCGSDDNVFEENDASLSPNIAFEATFCRGNVFRNNSADRCNYGFWLGFSWDTEISGNRMLFNRQAGIGVENGHGFQVRGNTFQANGHGVLLWSKYVERFAELYPESLTSYDWTIEENTFLRNTKAVRIAADQDHGIRPMPPETCGREEVRPHSHVIRKNNIQDNRLGIELHQADRTVIEGNTLHANVEANLRQEDCRETLVQNNLGSGGGYL